MTASQQVYSSDKFYVMLQDSILLDRPNASPEDIVALYLDGFVGKEIIDILDEMAA